MNDSPPARPIFVDFGKGKNGRTVRTLLHDPKTYSHSLLFCIVAGRQPDGATAPALWKDAFANQTTNPKTREEVIAAAVQVVKSIVDTDLPEADRYTPNDKEWENALQYSKGVSKLQQSFHRAYNHAKETNDSDLKKKIKTWCQQKHPKYDTEFIKYDTVRQSPYQPNPELPEWDDHVKIEKRVEVRTPAPPVELWGPVLRKLGRLLYGSKEAAQVPSKEVVCTDFTHFYHVASTAFITDAEYDKFKKDLSGNPSKEELDLKRIPSVNINDAPSAHAALARARSSGVVPVTPARPEPSNERHSTDSTSSTGSSPLPTNDPRILRTVKKYKKRAEDAEAAKEKAEEETTEMRQITKTQATAAEKQADNMKIVAGNNKTLTDTNQIITVDLQQKNEKVWEQQQRILKLKSDLLHIKSQLYERNKQFDRLMEQPAEEAKLFIKTAETYHAKSLFYYIADNKQRLAEVEAELKAEGYEHPRVLVADLTKLNELNFVPMIDTLSKAACIYDNNLEVVVLLTASDDRDGITNDNVDDCYCTLLPVLGYGKAHTFHIKANGKDYTLSIAGKSIDAAQGIIGRLLSAIGRCKGSERVGVESTAVEGTAEIPINKYDISSLFAEGRVADDQKGSHIEAFEVSKAHLTVEQQRAFKTARGKQPVQLVLHSCTLERKADGTVPLLEVDGVGKGEPLDLVFKMKVDIPFEELTEATKFRRVGALAFEGILLKAGDEIGLKKLLKTALENGFAVSLSRLSHETMSEAELQAFFMEVGASPDSFSEAAPIPGEDDIDAANDDYEVNDSLIKRPTFDVFGGLPDDLVYCSECRSIITKRTKCPSCGTLDETPASGEESPGVAPVDSSGAAMKEPPKEEPKESKVSTSVPSEQSSQGAGGGFSFGATVTTSGPHPGGFSFGKSSETTDVPPQQSSQGATKGWSFNPSGKTGVPPQQFSQGATTGFSFGTTSTEAPMGPPQPFSQGATTGWSFNPSGTKGATQEEDGFSSVPSETIFETPNASQVATTGVSSTQNGTAGANKGLFGGFPAFGNCSGCRALVVKGTTFCESCAKVHGTQQEYQTKDSIAGPPQVHDSAFAKPPSGPPPSMKPPPSVPSQVPQTTLKPPRKPIMDPTSQVSHTKTSSGPPKGAIAAKPMMDPTSQALNVSFSMAPPSVPPKGTAAGLAKTTVDPPQGLDTGFSMPPTKEMPQVNDTDSTKTMMATSVAKKPPTSGKPKGTIDGAYTSKENNGVAKTPSSKKSKGMSSSKTPKHNSNDIIGGLSRGVSTRRQLGRSQSERTNDDSSRDSGRQRRGRQTRSQSDRYMNG